MKILALLNSSNVKVNAGPAPSPSFSISSIYIINHLFYFAAYERIHGRCDLVSLGLGVKTSPINQCNLCNRTLLH